MRHQLLSSEVTFIDIQGHERRRPTTTLEEDKPKKALPLTPPEKPDSDGYYESFAILIANHSSVDEDIYNPKDPRLNNTSTKEWQRMIQAQYVTQEEENGNYRIIIRRFNLGHTYKRVQSQMSKVYTYVKKRRDHLHIEEPRNISWQGIVLMILGAMSTLISVALGQFSNEDDEGSFNYGRGRASPHRKKNKTPSTSQYNNNSSTSSYRGNVAVQNGLGSRANSFAYTNTGYPNMKHY